MAGSKCPWVSEIRPMRMVCDKGVGWAVRVAALVVGPGAGDEESAGS